eukprot:PhF_6_TR17882/c0_g1_i2/m.26852/K11344/EAF6; chromatin modification-related protein EAF6
MSSRLVVGSAASVSTTKKIEELMKARAAIQAELEKVEVQIYQVEGKYLRSGIEMGTILDGWVGVERPVARKKRPYTETDRIFTLSSATGLATAEKHGLLPLPKRKDDAPQGKTRKAEE